MDQVETRKNSSSLAWYIAAPAAALCVAASIVACGGQPAPTCGRPTRQEVAAVYIDGLNNRDPAKIKNVTDGSTFPSVDHAVDIRLKAFGGRHIVVRQSHYDDLVPDVSGVALRGDMDGGEYQERLPLRKVENGSWCLSINEVPLMTSPYFPATTTATTR